MNDKLKQQIAVLTKNTIMVIVFVILAIVFEHWWIVFFSAAFMTSIER